MSRVHIETIYGLCTLYRVGNPNGEGLWYDQKGIATGLVHQHGIKAAALPMSPHPVFSDGGFHWISVTDSIETLANWFTPEEVSRLAEFGYRLEVITATAHRTLTFLDYGYAHQVYRAEDLVSIETFSHTELHRAA